MVRLGYWDELVYIVVSSVFSIDDVVSLCVAQSIELSHRETRLEMHTFRPESDNTTFIRLASVENLHVDGQTKAAGA